MNGNYKASPATLQRTPTTFRRTSQPAPAARALARAIDNDGYSEVMEIRIRQAIPTDRDQLARLREALWPESPATEHALELEPILAGDTPGAIPLINFVAETTDGNLVGFAEVDLRSHADGCNPARPVGYLEGWYIAEEARHRGIGRRLLSAAEDWARSHGCVEMASDTWIDNELSQTCHEALGFEVVDRCVHYRKALWVQSSNRNR